MSAHPPPKVDVGSLLRRRVRCRRDDKLGNLSQGQADALEEWLFETHPRLTYPQVIQRVKEEFRVEVGDTTLRRWHQMTAQRRTIASIGDSMRNSNAVLAEFEKHPHDTYKAVLFLLGKYAFDQANLEGTKDPNLIDLTKLIITAKREERAVDQLKLAREKFHFVAAKAAKEHAEAIHEISRNSALDDEQKVQAVMLALFGAPPPK